MKLSYSEKSLYKQIGKNIRHYRIRKGMSQLDLAMKTGASQAYIGKIEKGERRVPLSLLIEIARALGVSVEDLLKNTPVQNLGEEEKVEEPIEELIKEILSKYPPAKRLKIIQSALETLVT